MKIAVIGGSGFIGTRLVKRLLDADQDVVIVDKNKSNFHPDICNIADVRKPELLKNELKGADVVINLAAEHRDDVSPKSLYDEVNVNGAENVCKVCDELGIKKIIFTSSVAVYGFAPKGTDETGEINYFNDYGRTKWEAEKVYTDWFEADSSKSLTIIRPTVVFGERNRGNVFNLLKQIASGKFLMVGSGKNIKSMAYVENVAGFLQYSLKFNEGKRIFNYIDKPDFDMNNLVAGIDNALGRNKKRLHWPYWIGYAGGLAFDFLALIIRKKFPISSIRVKKFCSDTMFNAENIKDTDYKPIVPLSEGLKKTIDFEFIQKVNDHVFYTE